MVVVGSSLVLVTLCFFDLPKFEYRVDSFAVQNTPLPEYRKKSENCHISAFQNTRFLHWNEYNNFLEVTK